MNDRMLGRLACVYALTMLLVQVALNVGLAAPLKGDGALILIAGLFATTVMAAGVSIGRGERTAGVIAIGVGVIALLLS